MDAEDIVLAFVDAWNRLDEERIYGLLADDIVYHNMPMAPVTGIAAVRAQMVESAHTADAKVRNRQR